MKNKNFQISKFYSRLFEVKQIIDNEIIPCGLHIGAQTNDQKLFESLNILSSDIEEHLTDFELTISECSSAR